MTGGTERYVTIDFEHPDTGIVWGLDEDNSVAVKSMEAHSSASRQPLLVEHMKLVRINDLKLELKNPHSLTKLYRKLVQLNHTRLELEFLEPIIILNKFNNILDVSLEDRIFNVKLPLGAVYDLNLFSRNIQKAFVAEHPALAFVQINFVTRSRQIRFECNRYAFKLLFASGPNKSFSCKYVLGFGDEDTKLSKKHIGKPLLIDINLGKW